MKSAIKWGLILIEAVMGIAILGYLFQPFLTKYLQSPYPVGSDYTLHLSNLEYFKTHRVFPVKAWMGQWWGGYPVMEGYPWLQYHLMLPLADRLGDTAQAMESYAIYGLLAYFLTAFIWLFYLAKNWLIALLLTLMVMYGADSGLQLFGGGFIIFAASQLMLPLVLLMAEIARNRKGVKFWILMAIAWALAFYLHPSITSLMITPAVLPLIFFNLQGKLNLNGIIRGFRVGILTILLAGLMIYQYADQSLRGADLTSTRLLWSEAPKRIGTIIERLNPLLIAVVILIMILLIIGRKKLGKTMRPYWLSLGLLLGIFTLMFFKIGSLDTIFFAERMSWGISLMLVAILAKLSGELFSGKMAKIGLTAISLGLVLGYGYLLVQVKPEQLMPLTLKEDFAHAGTGTGFDLGTVIPKYDKGERYPLLDWQQGFDNYRTEGLDYIVYMWSNLLMPNSRYKGFFQPLKGLLLHWSGLVTESELGMLESGSREDMTESELNRSLFWLDWYAIRRFQDMTAMAALTKNLGNLYVLAPYWRLAPIRQKTETSKDISYYSLSDQLIGPMYASTNAPLVAVVGGEGQYDNIIRVLSYSQYTSQKLIPIYLGKSLGVIKAKDLSRLEMVILYGYGPSLRSTQVWTELQKYVEGGGKLIIETGQKVGESASPNLPAVFPIMNNQLEVLNQEWPVAAADNWLVKEADQALLKPLKYKALPFSISKTSNQSLRFWAKPGLKKDETVVLAYGNLGKGKVIWSGLNLPYHAVDNRNEAEIKIFENLLNWLMEGQKISPVGSYQAEHPTSEIIRVNGSEAKGVLFKENYHSGWQAKINGRKVKIYQAGLEQMYVMIPADITEFMVELNYGGAWLHWLILGVSGLTLGAVLVRLGMHGKINDI